LGGGDIYPRGVFGDGEGDGSGDEGAKDKEK